MTEASKIPITKLLLHVINVLHVCDLSSVTTDRVKDYLKDRFKDALPCENELDFILRNVIKTVKLSQNLNPDYVPVKEDIYEYEKEDIGIRDQDFQDQPIKERILRKRRIPTVSYALKKGPGGGSNTCKANWYSLKVPGTSKTTRIYGPFLPKNAVANKASKALEPGITEPSKENTVPPGVHNREQRTAPQKIQRIVIKKSSEEDIKKLSAKVQKLVLDTNNLKKNWNRDFKKKSNDNSDDDNSDDQTSAASEDNDSMRIHSNDRGYIVKQRGHLRIILQKRGRERSEERKVPFSEDSSRDSEGLSAKVPKQKAKKKVYNKNPQKRRKKKEEGKVPSSSVSEQKRRKKKEEGKVPSSSVSEEPNEEKAIKPEQKRPKPLKRKMNENIANAHGKETTESEGKTPTFNPNARHTEKEKIEFLKEYFEDQLSKNQITEDQITKVVQSTYTCEEALIECTRCLI